MVATTFAADTPLFVAGIVGQNGIASNWIWWCSASGGMLTVFFFARLWRRAGILTDLEFIELRYSGKSAAVLRGFKAVYFGLFMNCVIIGWVNLAMMKILAGLFPSIDPRIGLVAAASITVLYVSMSGLWGVAVADAFQFIVAMTGCIVLAVFAVNRPEISEHGGLAALLPAHVFDFVPQFDFSSTAVSSSSGAAAASGGSAMPGVYRMPLMFFAAFIGVQWWASWYPGAEPGGGGYISQRIMSARDEKSGLLATLWFVIAHYCVRSWPWIMAGLAALVLYPNLAANQKEDGYVFLMRDVLPSPYRGLLLAAFFGAYMSTLSTQLNWGSSYIINDLYKRFIRKEKSEKHYVAVARIFTFVALFISLLITFYALSSIKEAWEFVLEFSAGSGFVLIMRWYWWRLNAVSEIVSILTPLLAGVVIRFVLPFAAPGLKLPVFPESLFVIVPITLVCTIAAAYLTDPVEKSKLVNFYSVVRPGGPGWTLFRNESGIPGGKLGALFLGWISGTILVYSILFLIGSIILGKSSSIPVYGISAIVSGLIVYLSVRAEFRRD